MWKKTQYNKHKKQTSASPEVIELYRNKGFVTDSLESACASSVKITANGQITTKSVGKVGDRHLQAKLQLPSLQDRCAISPNKDLFRLSTLLAENEAQHQPQDQLKDVQVEPEVQNAKYKLPWDRFAYVHSKDCKLAKRAYFADQLNVAPAINLKRSHAKDGYQVEVPKEIPDTNVRRKQKKVKRIKKQTKIQTEDSTDESHYETAASSREPNQSQRSKAEEPTKQKYCKHAADPQEMEATQLPRNIVPKLKDDFHVNWLRQFMKNAVQFFDDWHSYTILLFLSAFVYLVYMLCYDINEYISEERRYLAKMRSAGLVAKCFYYIMRLLKVPIF